MRLGTQTGSFVNYMYANTVSDEIKEGTPATLLFWTDRKPGTVTKVFEKGAYTYLHVRRDVVEYHQDRSGNYDIVDGDDNNYEIFRFKTDGSSGFQRASFNERTGRYVKESGGGLTVGVREYYLDPHF